MTELEKIAYAKTFIDKLANGINPLDDTPVADEDIVNNVRISRCFFYISDILRQVINNGGLAQVPTTKQHKAKFKLADNILLNLKASEKPIAISEITNYLNSFIDQENMKKISHSAISSWLIDLGLLENILSPNGKYRKVPTVQGRTIGITEEERFGQYGNYFVLLYSASAQQFIFDNLDAILEHKCSAEENQGMPWTAEQDEHLQELFRNNISVNEIAKTLQRSKGGIRARLKKLGLIDNRSEAM